MKADRTEFHEITIEPDGSDFAAVGHGQYERWSVLAGQYRRCVLGFYPTVQEALSEYPGATVVDYRTSSAAIVPDCPPEGFDPADAGERWDEDY